MAMQITFDSIYIQYFIDHLDNVCWTVTFNYDYSVDIHS